MTDWRYIGQFNTLSTVTVLKYHDQIFHHRLFMSRYLATVFIDTQLTICHHSIAATSLTMSTSAASSPTEAAADLDVTITAPPWGDVDIFCSEPTRNVISVNENHELTEEPSRKSKSYIV